MRRLRAVATGPEMGDSLWKEISLGDRIRGHFQGVVVNPRRADRARLEAGSVAAASVDLNLSSGHRPNVRETVDCYFDDGMEHLRLIRLHFVRDEVFVA